MKALKTDLVRTINEGDEVPNYSDSSDAEDEFQPSKQKEKKKKDFNINFEFVSSTAEYNKDVWNDLAKYVKRKATTRVDEKIEKARKELKKEERKEAAEGKGDNEMENDEESNVSSEEEDGDSTMSDDENSLSEDELVKDKIRTKEKHLGKRTRKKIKLEEEKAKVEFEEMPYNENVSFYEMNISRPLLKAISAMNYMHPTPIQAATIPVALLGRDICGCAATGTGKTAAYMLPTLERLMYKPTQTNPATRVLVLVPTRELGVQVYQVTKQLSQFINVSAALSVGGLDVKVQEAAMRKCPDVVIATPGRLIDHIKNTPSFSLTSVEVLILDEADRMLDEYFQEQMTEIIRQCSTTRQTLLFSATMTEAVDQLAAVSLDKPVKVFVDNNQDVASNLRQEFVKVRKDNEGDREALLSALVCRTFHDHCMVFVQTKKQAHRLHILLGLLGIKVGELHGDLTQVQRLDGLSKFRKEEIDVLVATDVAARGLDIPGVKTVINFVMPPTLEHYIHRVGRTARAGKGGVSVSLAGESERNIIKQVIKNSRLPVKSRVIPHEIVNKYRIKVQKLDVKVKEILDEEYQDKLLLKAEAQANRAEKVLTLSMDKKSRTKKGKEEKPNRREWFQTARERKEEQKRLRLTTPERNDNKKRKRNDSDSEEEHRVPKQPNERNNKKGDKNNNKKKKKFEETADDRVAREMQKVALLQARLAKRKQRPKKIKAVSDFDKNGTDRAKPRKKKSSFANELTNTSKKGLKSMRHEANQHNRNTNKNKKKFVKGKPERKKGSSSF